MRNYNEDIEPRSYFYKLTSNKIIYIYYGVTFTNFGTEQKALLERIVYAERDGKQEYKLLTDKINRLKADVNVLSNDKKRKKLKAIKLFLKHLPKYNEEPIIEKEKSFKEYLVDTNYKTSFEELKNKYVVFDVETNGLRRRNDDLLSISIYNPTNGLCYNRYFPLDMQPLVLTTLINGITEKDLINAKHLTQEEFNEIVSYFNLENVTILTYSGGEGTFDPQFLKNYLKRHNIVGFEKLKFKNIKSLLPECSSLYDGQLSKDNLCRLLKIEGVSEVHSGLNDCLLERKLFEKLMTNVYFFTDYRMFRFNPENPYIVPITLLQTNSGLIKAANLKVPSLKHKSKLIYEYKFPKNVKIKKYETNITGISLEERIRYALNAKEQDNYDFLEANKRKCEYIGTLIPNIDFIPITIEDEGRLRTSKKEFEKFVDDVNKTSEDFILNVNPIIKFIKDNILKMKKLNFKKWCFQQIIKF